jgi:hypothetical protein
MLPMLPMLHVVWQPKRTFLSLPGLKVWHLVATFIALDLALSLSTLGYFAAGIDKAMAGNPLLTPGAKPFVLAFSILFSSLINIAIILGVAVVFLLIVKIAGAVASYRNIVGMLVLATVPALLGRALRNASYLSGVAADLTQSQVALYRFMPDFGAAATRSLKAFDLFDVWTAALVVIGFGFISGMKRVPALASALAIWGILQMLLLRIYLSGTAP